MAQRCLLDGLLNTLLGLGLRQRKPLASMLKEWHEANRELAQLEAGDKGKDRRDSAERRNRSARDKVRQLLESDSETQRLCLEAVREKIGTNQYKLDSIPFELFQNADDAVAEFRTLRGEGRSLDEFARRFVVDTDGRAIWFAAWGRAINRHQAAGFEGSVHGFDQDLEKMLTLGWSDKERDEYGATSTTGKFGLGFKSVLLATDCPRVVSSRLAFEVRGGLFPAPLVEGRKPLEDRLRELGPRGVDGTIIELPLDGVEAQEILDRFTTLAPLLVIFAREISTCVIRCPNGLTDAFRWQGTALSGESLVEIGELPGQERGRVLVLRGGTSATLLALGQCGVQALPPRWPTVWVTAPTRQEERLGFAINAPFELDVGRSQLAYASRRNEEVAAVAGRELGRAIVELHAASAAWPAFAAALGLRRGRADPVLGVVMGSAGQALGGLSGATRPSPPRDGLGHGRQGDATAGVRVRRPAKRAVGR